MSRITEPQTEVENKENTLSGFIIWIKGNNLPKLILSDTPNLLVRHPTID